MPGKHEGEPPAEETSVVDREAEAETIVVDRAAEAETIIVDRVDRTVVVDRGPASDGTAPDGAAPDGPAPDGTVAVTRERPAAPGPALPRGRRRRGMSMPPVAPGYGRGAIEAVGPGAVSTYEPREIAAPPVEGVPFAGVESTRAAAPSMPSVSRRSRRVAAVSLALVAAACVVSVVGLVALGIALIRG